MTSGRARALLEALGWILAAGLLLAVPLVFHRGFAEQFSYIKLVLTKALVLFGLVSCVLGLIWRQLPWPRRFALGPPVAFLIAAVLLSCWNSPVPAFSLVEAEYFLCGPLWLLLLILWGGGEARLRALAVLVAAAGTVVAAIALLQWSGHDPLLFGGYRVVWGTMVGRMRLYSTFGNPNFVAGYLIGAIFLALALAGVSSKFPWRITWCVSMATMFAAIVGTRSRAAWVALAAGLLVARIVWRRGVKLTDVSSPPTAPGGVSPALCLAILPALAYMASFARTVDALLTHFEGRLYLWRVSWPMFAEHPLFGSGWGTFQLCYLDLQARFLQAHPELVRHWSHIHQLHNDPLQILLEAGVVGLVALGWVLWTYGREARRALSDASRPTRLWIGASAGGVTAILVNSFFNFQLAVPATLLLLFTLVAVPSLLLATENTRKESETPQAPEAGEKKPSLYGLRVIASLAVVALAAVLLLQIAGRAVAEYDYMVAIDFERRGDITRAEQVFRRGLEHAPLHGRLRYGLARALYIQGKYSEALTEVLLAERTFADSHLEVLKARIQDQMGLAGPALETYRHALALDPTLKSVQADVERLSSGHL
jgi:O-antigen ligase